MRESTLDSCRRRASGERADAAVTEAELKEVIIHLAFYAGWPRAMSAITVAKRVFAEDDAA